jgi:hypothetical protein
MDEFAKKLHRRMTPKAGSLPTKEPKRHPGELLPGGIKDVARRRPSSSGTFAPCL